MKKSKTWDGKEKERRTITVHIKTYNRLGKYGEIYCHMGDTYEDIINNLLDKVGKGQY